LVIAMLLTGLPGIAAADSHCPVGATGVAAGASIQAAIDAAADHSTICLVSGTYAGGITIGKSITLVGPNAGVRGDSARSGEAVIEAPTGGNGLTVAAGTTVTLDGLHIIGGDGPPGIEKAAIYFIGANSNSAVRNSIVEAAGDHGLMTEFNAAVTGMVIERNRFSGKTFTGEEPGGDGFAAQFTTENVPRQLVVMGGGAGGTAGQAVVFRDNLIDGTAGGLNVGNNEQGNTLVTLDIDQVTVTGNVFAGETNRFGSALRVRRPAAQLAGNTFTSARMGAATSHLYLQNQVVAAASTVAANTFDKAAYAASAAGATSTIYTHAIQGAVNESAASGLVTVLPGTYAGPIDVNKPVTLEGEPGAVVTIDTEGTALTVSGNDVTVRGLEITGSGSQHFVDYRTELWTDTGPIRTTGIIVSGTNATIENNHIHTLRTGVRLNTLNTSTVADNVIENTKGGVIVLGSPGMTALASQVSDNSQEVIGNEWGIVALPWSASAPAGDATVAAAVLSVSDANNGMSVLDRRFATNNRSHVSLVAGSTPGDDQGLSLKNGLGNPREPFQTFAQALGAVAAGGTVEVHEGTGGAAYTGGVTIGKVVDLVASGQPRIEGGVVIDAAGTTFSNFHVTNPNGGHGIRVNVGDVTVSDNTITNVGDDAAFTAAAQGIYVRPAADASNVTLRRNVISDVGRVNNWSHKGIFLGDSNNAFTLSNVTIADNVISNVVANPGSSGGKGGYGITTNIGSNGAGSTPNLLIENNTISAISGWWVHAIGIEGNAPNADITRNTISGLQGADRPVKDEVAIFFEKNPAGGTATVDLNRLTGAAFGVALHPAEPGTYRVNARNNWWGSVAGPLPASAAATGIRSAVGDRVDVSPWCLTSACTTFGTGVVTPPPVTPPVTPPVFGDTPPPPPPKVTPPPPATPPAPITVPPGQTIQVPRGGTTGFVGGQPAPVVTVTPPPVPPPAQRTPQQVQQVQQQATQLATNLISTMPSNSTSPPPVSVTQTDSGAQVNGLLSTPDGQNKPVPAENILSVSTGGTTVLATSTDAAGNSLPIGGDGSFNTPQGGSIGTAVGGLTPGSSGQIVAFSDPQLLGTFTADADGLFRGEISVPHWLEPGDHTLVFNGQGAQGEVTLAMSITVAESDVFSDVAAGSTHAVAISRLRALGIAHGYDDGTYRPAESIRRAQMAAFLARALGLDTDGATTDLSDVAGVHAEAIAAIVDAGVASGYGDGTFQPAAFVTRGQMATFLANAAGLDPVQDGDLTDVTGVHAGAINAVIAAGIANGHTGGMFRPGEFVNRAQMATFIVNLVDYLAEGADD
jgi:nitrous oxidase accessory protein NosD